MSFLSTRIEKTSLAACPKEARSHLLLFACVVSVIYWGYMAKSRKNLAYWSGKKWSSNREVQYVWVRQSANLRQLQLSGAVWKQKVHFWCQKASSPQKTGSKKESEAEELPLANCSDASEWSTIPRSLDPWPSHARSHFYRCLFFGWLSWDTETGCSLEGSVNLYSGKINISVSNFFF